jgi:hypothetical protein
VTGTADLSGWTYGEAGGGERLTAYGSALRPPVLYPSREAGVLEPFAAQVTR